MNEKQLKKIISKALNVSENKISEKSSSSNLEEWDSLGHLSIMSSIDKILKGKISVSALHGADSFIKISSILKKKKILK
jgi:acyl carrier protein